MKDKVRKWETGVLGANKGLWEERASKARLGSQAFAGGPITAQTCW